jgi:hypothetical protein
MPVSVYSANAICANVLSADMWLALLTAYPDANDTGSTLAEPAGIDYARLPLSHAYWGTPVNGASTYNFDLTVLPTTNWGTIIAYALCTALAAGQVEAFEHMSSPVDVTSGSRLTILSGMLYYGVQ